MKIGVASSGNNLESRVSPVFGRCAYFIIVGVENSEIKDYKSIINSSVTESGGAGIKAAHIVANEGIDVLISGNVGPNSYDLLKQLGIKIYKIKEGSVEENIKLYLENKLEELTAAGPSPGRGMRGKGRR